MADLIRIKRGNIVSLPTLNDGEFGLAEDTKTVYVGTTTGNAKLAMATIEAVIAPTLLNSWVNFGGSEKTAGYYKDSFGIVHLVGAIKSGIATTNTTLFILPSGYRPLSSERFAAYSNDGLSTGTIAVDALGNVLLVSGNNTIFSLSGVSFRTT